MSTLTQAPLPAATSPRLRWLVLAVVLAADILDLLDATITNVAAPTITRDLHGGNTLVQWLGASYALALGVLLVLGGRLGDRYGRRRLFLVGLVGFTVASVACGLAFSPASIVVCRLVQGAFGALLIPQGFGMLAAVFPRDQLGKAFSAFGPVMGISAVGGPILAGFLIHADLYGLGWRAMFLINIVLGGLAIVAAVRILPKDEPARDTVLDGLGSVLLALAMLGLLYGLITGSGAGWTLAPVLALVAGAVCFALFCWRQRVARNPLIEPSLLRNRGFTSGLVLGVVYFAAVAGLLYVFSLFLQNGLGYGPLRAAIGLAPVAAGIVVASLVCFRLIARFGRLLVLAGLLMTLAGVAMFLVLVTTLGTTVPGWLLAVPASIVGLGMGTSFGTVFDVTIGDVDGGETGSASGSLNAVQQLANATGAAVVTTVYFTALPTAHQVGAMTRSLLVVGGISLACCALVWLLPRKARED